MAEAAAKIGILASRFQNAAVMTSVARTVLVEFGAAFMYELVSDIESYPAFLPWCSSAHVQSRNGNRTVATLEIDYRGLRQSFTTENTGNPAQNIQLKLIAGPFRELQGEWQFQPLGACACKVSLALEYEFTGRVLGTLLGPVFHHIADTLVEAFVHRAEQLAADSAEVRK